MAVTVPAESEDERGHRSGPWVRLRGLLASPVARIGAGGAAAVVAAGAIAVLLSDDNPPANEERTRPFYLEAEGSVSSQARTIGTNAAGEPDTSQTTIRWWWRDADHFCVAYDTIDALEGNSASVFVGDGEWQWFYRAAENSYSQHPLQPLPDGYTVRPITFSVILRPLPVPRDVDAVDELLDQLRTWNTSPDSWAKAVGEETMLRRRVTVLEWGPSGSSSTTHSDGTTTQSSSGHSTLWVDMERMVALRHRSESEAQSFEGQVTRLDWDADPPGDRFGFEPPRGATKGSSSSGSSQATPTR